MLTHLKQVDTSSEAAKVALQVAVSAGGVLRTNLVARTSDILSSCPVGSLGWMFLVQDLGSLLAC